MICSADRCSRPTRSLPSDRGAHARRSAHEIDGVLAVEFVHRHRDVIPRRGGDREPGDVGGDRQFATAAIDQHREEDPARPAEVGDFVECGAHGAAGKEHVVDDHHGGPLEVGRQPGLAHLRARTDRLEVVAIEGDVERAALEAGGRAAVRSAARGDRRAARRGAGFRPARRSPPPAVRSTSSDAMRASTRPMAGASRRRVG